MVLGSTNHKRGVVHIIGEGLHHIGPTPGVSHLRDARLLLEDDLCIAGNAGALDRGQTQSLVKRVSVQRLCAAKYCSHGLDYGTNHIVVRVLKDRCI